MCIWTRIGKVSGPSQTDPAIVIAVSLPSWSLEASPPSRRSSVLHSVPTSALYWCRISTVWIPWITKAPAPPGGVSQCILFTSAASCLTLDILPNTQFKQKKSDRHRSSLMPKESTSPGQLMDSAPRSGAPSHAMATWSKTSPPAGWAIRTVGMAGTTTDVPCISIKYIYIILGSTLLAFRGRAQLKLTKPPKGHFLGSCKIQVQGSQLLLDLGARDVLKAWHLSVSFSQISHT